MTATATPELLALLREAQDCLWSYWKHDREATAYSVHEKVRLFADELSRRLTAQPAVAGEGTSQNVADLHPNTALLVKNFAKALAEKLRAAEIKYGYNHGWSRMDWENECRHKLYEHLAKGDPRDVANYCAFMWTHGWSTAPSPSPADPARERQRFVEWRANEPSPVAYEDAWAIWCVASGIKP